MLQEKGLRLSVKKSFSLLFSRAHRVASVAIAIEMFAVRRSEDDVLEQTQPLLRIVQSLKMLGFWLHPQSTSDLPSKSPQMSSLVAPKPFDSIFNYDTMVKSGGFYR